MPTGKLSEGIPDTCDGCDKDITDEIQWWPSKNIDKGTDKTYCQDCARAMDKKAMDEKLK